MTITKKKKKGKKTSEKEYTDDHLGVLENIDFDKVDYSKLYVKICGILLPEESKIFPKK